MAVRYQDGFDDGATDDLVCSLQKPAEAPYLTGAERAVLAYADGFMTNHLSVDDATLDRVCDHLDEGQVVKINARLAASGFGKFAAVLQMVEDLASDFAETADECLP